MEVVQVAVKQLRENPLNAELFAPLPPDEYQALKSDIWLAGIRVPLRATKDYLLIAGHRRLSIARELGLSTVPCILEEYGNSLEIEDALIKDNLYRRHLSPIERARAAMKLEEIEAERARARQLATLAPFVATRPDYVQSVVANSPQLIEHNSKSRKSRDVAAEAVGLKTAKYRELKDIIGSDNEALIQAVHEGSMTVHAAWTQIHELPDDEEDRDEDKPELLYCHSCIHAITHTNDYDYFTCVKRERSYYIENEPDPSSCADYATERAPVLTKKPVNQAMMQTVFSSESQEYYTPTQFLDATRHVMGEIDLDPASCDVAQHNVKAANYYTLVDDGLSKAWYGKVWLNPPYGRTEGRSNQDAWSEKLEQEYQKGNVTEAILLVKAALGYKWFEELWCKWHTCLARERLSFIKDDGTDDGQSKQATAFIYFGSNPAKFAGVFGQFGRIITPDPV